jgi:hypothetical protein
MTLNNITLETLALARLSSHFWPDRLAHTGLLPLGALETVA